MISGEIRRHMHTPVRRKVLRTGGVSLAITLPKQWTEKTHVQSGDEVLVFMDEKGDLIIQAPKNTEVEKETPQREIEIDITRANMELVKQKIIASYLAGYRVMKLVSKKPITQEYMQVIDRLTTSFIGLEVIEHSTYSILLQDLSSPQSIDVLRFIKRMNKIIQEMLENTFKGIRLRDTQILETVVFQEPNVDKIYYMLSRQFRSILYDLSIENPLKIELHSVIDYERIIKRLEGIADHCNNLANTAIRILEEDMVSMKNPREVLFSRAETVREHLRDVMRTFYTGDTIVASQLIHQTHEMREQLRETLIESPDKTLHVLHFHMLRVLERITSYIADIGEATINIHV